MPEVEVASKESSRRETATLGGGCFWCTEAVFIELKGVLEVLPGYAGGQKPNPTYEDVCTGRTGHAEVVSVTFDPQGISYADLLRVFFSVHDPTTRDRQGNDRGPQYRSIVLYHSSAQKRTAEEVIREVDGGHLWGGRVVTELAPFVAFYPAEPYHRQYFRKNPDQAYCQAVVAPKVAKFRKEFLTRLQGAR
jgi:peptide-methionine (S)-S-oxide reductase